MCNEKSYEFSFSSDLACSFGFKPIVFYEPDYYYFMGTNFVLSGDFNNDGYIDLTTANYDNSSVGILLGNGDGTFQPEMKFYTGNNTSPTVLTVGDFNNDGRLDVITTSYPTSNMIVLLGNGDGTLTAQKPISTGSNTGPYGIIACYINKDNILDLAVADSDSTKVSIFTGYGNGSFLSQKTVSTGSNSYPNSVATGDFNHDNLTDLAIANWGTNKMGIVLGLGNGTFRSQVTYTAGNSTVWIDVGDFNGDNNLDVAAVNVDDNTISVFLGFGNGTFNTQTVYPIINGTSPIFLTINDVNGDGYLDLGVLNINSNSINILFGQGDGTFNMQITLSTGDNSEPYGLNFADFNRDNRSDIAVADYNTDYVGIILRAC